MGVRTRRFIRRLAVVGAVACAVGALSAGPALAAEHRVVVRDDTYDDGDGDRSRTRIVAGDTVVWTWSDGNEHRHTVSAVGGKFDSDPNCSALVGECGDATRAPMSVTFEQTGEYHYYCKVHSLGMRGTIVVEAPSDDSSNGSGEDGSGGGENDGPALTGGGDGEPEPTATASSGSNTSPAPSSGDGGAGDAETQDGDDGNGERPRAPTVATTFESSTGNGQDDDAPSGGSARLPSFDMLSRTDVRTTRPADPGVMVAPPTVPPTPTPFPTPMFTPDDGDEDLAVEIPMDTGGGGIPVPLTATAITLVVGSGAALTKFILLGPRWS